MTTNVLDTLVGDILPHVRIKKIIVEKDTPTLQAAPKQRVYNKVHTGDRKITLQMELYQRKDTLLTNSWLADVDLNLNDNGITSIFDCFNLNVITVQSNKNLSYLRKSQPTNKIQGQYSIFVKDQLTGQKLHGGAVTDTRSLDYWNLLGGHLGLDGIGVIYKSTEGQKAKGDPFACLHRSNLHLSALVGLTSTDFTGNPGKALQGKVREEIYKGDVYYAIPYEYTFSWKDKLSHEELSDRLLTYSPDDSSWIRQWKESFNSKWINHVDLDEEDNFFAPNLGVVVYTSLNLSNVIEIPSGAEKWKNTLDMEGPPSAEIVIRGGEIAKTRQAFVDYDGREWSGPVHYYGPSSADGKVKGIPSVDGYVGYMAGSRHHAGTSQSKLSILEVPNGLIHDTVDIINQKVPDQMFVTKPDGTVVMTGASSTSNVKPAYQEIEEELALIGGTLGVKYQKETIKDIYKNTRDNDNEFSKLYLTRNRNNSAHGMFYIDFFNLMLNNSYYLGFLNREALKNPYYINQILTNSKIIDLKIKRKRINPESYRNGYKNFAERTPYEEPTKILACLSDKNAFKSFKSTYKSPGASFNEILLSTNAATSTRYFAFSDTEVSDFTGGEYQYELELKFFDATPVYIRKKLAIYKNTRKQLEAYYKLASSSVKKKVLSEVTISKETGQSGDEKHTKKSLYVPYYDNNYKTFRPEFSKLAYDDPEKMFHDEGGAPVWTSAPKHIINYLRVFSPIENWSDTNNLAEKYTKLLFPGPAISGSPEGILLVSKLYDNMISQLEKILNSAKKKKSNNSNILQDKSSPSDSQVLPDSFYNNMLCDSQGIIYENYTFDHPKEIFKATANKNYYVDFLSLESELFSSYSGIRVLTKDYFLDRCVADLAKYTTYALADPLLLSGQSAIKEDGGSIAPRNGNSSGQSWMIANKDGSYDTLSNQMYSYLTPSFVELTDSTKQDPSYRFQYRAFSPQIKDVVAGSIPASVQTVYGPDYFNHQTMNSVLISLANFIKNKNDLGYADLSDSYAEVSDLTSPTEYNKAKIPVNTREAYKSYFSKYNITVHDLGPHNVFFGPGSNREPGADPAIKTMPNFDDGLTSDYFSDGMLIPNDFFNEFINSNTQAKLDVPRGTFSHYTWKEEYPNVYKFFFIFKQFEKWGFNPNFIRPLIRDVFEVNAPQNNALKFFNFNMVAAIEKFVGHGGAATRLALDDRWEPLKAADMSSGQRLFCRIKYWKPNLLRGVEHFPVVDRYFILTENPDEASAPPAVPIIEESVFSSVPAMIAYFESQNQSMLQDMANLLEKGMIDLGILDMPQTGPDPSPVNIPASGMITGNAAMAGAAQQMQQADMQQTGMQQAGMQQAAQAVGQGSSGDSGQGDY